MVLGIGTRNVVYGLVCVRRAGASARAENHGAAGSVVNHGIRVLVALEVVLDIQRAEVHDQLHRVLRAALELGDYAACDIIADLIDVVVAITVSRISMRVGVAVVVVVVIVRTVVAVATTIAGIPKASFQVRHVQGHSQCLESGEEALSGASWGVEN